MAQIGTCTLQIKGRTGTISFSSMPKKDQRWIAAALLDMFTVDDAYYDDESGAIKLQNWHTSIDIEILRQDLHALFDETSRKVIIT